MVFLWLTRFRSRALSFLVSGCLSVSWVVDAVAEDSQKVNALKTAVCDALPRLEGWCSEEKARSLIDLILEIKPTIYVEVGVFGGSSLFPALSAVKFLGQGCVVAIDPWERWEAIKEYDFATQQEMIRWWGNVDFDRIFTSYSECLKTHGLMEYCVTLRAPSERAAKDLFGAIDILHLDGTHAEEAFVRDVMLYAPKVAIGGYIILNDALWGCTQKAKALLLQSCDIVRVIDNGNCIFFRKMKSVN